MTNYTMQPVYVRRNQCAQTCACIYQAKPWQVGLPAGRLRDSKGTEVGHIAQSPHFQVKWCQLLALRPQVPGHKHNVVQTDLAWWRYFRQGQATEHVAFQLII
jgi:hypothetical protein